MVDVDTFLTTLYVMVDDFCKSELPPETRPGPDASLSRGEVATLAIFGQWGRFESERAFYRYADRHLRRAFPTLPDRTQFNRLMRRHQPAIEAFSLYLAEQLEARQCPYEVLDSAGVVVRDLKRRGNGWLAGQADMGYCGRLGWFEGFQMLIAANPMGVITGFGAAPASTREIHLADTFLAARQHPHPRLLTVGKPALGPYLTDKGFRGRVAHQRWRSLYNARFISPPYANARTPWPRSLRRWVAGLRQIIETVFDKLLNTFRLHRERPHSLSGFLARLAAKVALHNFCIWLNQHLGRPALAFADLLSW
jgi:hypothetical protein